MKILLCNDDGIRAEGIVALHDALIDHHGEHGGPLAAEVFAIAPATVQSATGHGITFRTPLITKTVRVNERMTGIAVDGRPADCIKLGLAALWPERFGTRSRPDLVISGMNIGANVGINVLYSGTCAAALEAAFLGVPSIAVSLNLGDGEPDWRTAARHARAAIERLLGHARRAGRSRRPLPPHCCLNVNVPVTESDGPIPRMVVCPMNVHGLVDKFVRNRNPLGETYYWSDGKPMEFHGSEPGKDVERLIKGAITVTPLRYDLTEERDLAFWRGALRPAAPARSRAARKARR
ncbi:MAG: 5'/3'-nucleotidase SurE [Phycisphaerales bacterium]